ncbi:hypothetical protein LINPERHAP1_LOCUS204, partial [Linum perenne]
MNPDVVDIGSSSFIPSEFIPVVHDEVSSVNLDDPLDDDADQDEEFPKGVFYAFNHHRILIVLGEALLLEETAE